MAEFTEQTEHELISTSLEVEQLDTTLFRSKSLWVPSRARGVFGGQVISQALVSATKTVDPEYALHSLHKLFVEAGHIPLAPSRPHNLLTFQIAMPANIPSPESLLPEETVYEQLAADEKLPQRLRDVYLRFAQDRRRSPIESRFVRGGPDEKEGYICMYWMKVRKGRGSPNKFEQPFQKCMLAYLSDHRFNATGSRALGLTREPGPRQQTMGSSLDHSIFFYNHEFDCTEYILYVMSSPAAAHGRGVVLGRMYTQDGALIAVLSQETVLRIDPKKAAELYSQKKEAKL